MKWRGPRSTTAAGKAKAEKHDVLDMLAAHNLEQLTEGDFVPGVDVDDEEEDEELPAGLAAALGDKEDKKKKNVPKKEDKCRKEKGPRSWKAG